MSPENMNKSKRRFRIPAFWQAVIVTALIYFIFSYPALMLPKTLLVQYMIISVAGILLYFSFDEQRWEEFKSPLLSVLRNPGMFPLRWFFMLAIPALAAYTTYTIVKPSLEAPVELRQAHPSRFSIKPMT